MRIGSGKRRAKPALKIALALAAALLCTPVHAESEVSNKTEIGSVSTGAPTLAPSRPSDVRVSPQELSGDSAEAKQQAQPAVTTAATTSSILSNPSHPVVAVVPASADAPAPATSPAASATPKAAQQECKPCALKADAIARGLMVDDGKLTPIPMVSDQGSGVATEPPEPGSNTPCWPVFIACCDGGGTDCFIWYLQCCSVTGEEVRWNSCPVQEDPPGGPVPPPGGGPGVPPPVGP
ncbi:hypothetical protein [Aureliella helgolandensis]|uniref:Uncharacterized protein n=1 Tax=Aureliella helgolandensis TaxID=2527968 RepID=A0A518G2K9_9BACT|nr:hypothetical protein [Aureliella helgolandensis]QDV22800.1 hypothetical protein Q31a_10910 [Aureliella helgolandensis]